MNRENIIIIVCIGVFALFYLFQVDSTPIKEVNYSKKPIIQNANKIIKKVLEQEPMTAITTTSDSIKNKDSKPK